MPDLFWRMRMNKKEDNLAAKNKKTPGHEQKIEFADLVMRFPMRI